MLLDGVISPSRHEMISFRKPELLPSTAEEAASTLFASKSPILLPHQRLFVGKSYRSELRLIMDPLQAPNPGNRKGLTASQWLYREYAAAKRKQNRAQMDAAREGLVRICIHACGNIRPFWSPPTPPAGARLVHPYARFGTDGYKDRREHAENFVQQELKRRMTATEARYVARRCRLRLIDEIRSDTRREWGIGRKSNDEYRVALNKVKHLQPLWRWKGDDPPRLLWQHIKANSGEWRDATNVTIASDWYRSEGWIRKVRKRLAERLWSLAENDEQRKALEVLRLKPKRQVG